MLEVATKSAVAPVGPGPGPGSGPGPGPGPGTATAVAGASAAPAVAKPAASGGSFREFLSELNPLQYIPVIGTIYRAVTGDTIPDTARLAGGLVVSGLAGGPVGLATNIAMTVAEHAAGVDPEKWGQTMLARAGIGGGGTVGHAAASHVSVAAETAAPATAPGAGWSGAQLAAYGVTIAGDGALRRGAVTGADVLNDMELLRLHRVVA